MRQRRTPASTVPIEFTIRALPSLPAASWIAMVAAGRVSVVCGRRVDAHARGVFEGVWDGPFEAFDCDRAENVFGSGMRLRDGRIVFVSPSHTLEGLYVHQEGDRLVISNSLAFLLEHEGIEVPRDQPLCRRLSTSVLGMQRYERVLFSSGRGVVSRVLNATLEVDDEGTRVRPRASTARFEHFESYASHVRQVLRRVVENGRAREGRRGFELMTTVSSGYDSAACAALATALGCREALTLQTGRSGRSDSGAAVAEALQLTLHAYDAGEAESVGIAQEFFGSGMGGEDLPFAAFEPHLGDTMLLTGFHGDKLWEYSVQPNDQLIRGDISGSSLIEFRLRVGFVVVPVPFIGALRHEEICRITHSDEMQAFRVGGAYDRPIARRIAEEAGVPRDAFGQRKEMVSVLAFMRLGLLPPVVRECLRRYVRTHASLRDHVADRWWYTRSLVWRVARRIAVRARMPRLVPKIERAILGGDWRVFEHSAPLSSELVFRWALAGVRARYRVIDAEAHDEDLERG